jgi:uncharacterized protein YhaN
MYQVQNLKRKGFAYQVEKASRGTAASFYLALNTAQIEKIKRLNCVRPDSTQNKQV